MLGVRLRACPQEVPSQEKWWMWAPTARARVALDPRFFLRNEARNSPRGLTPLGCSSCKGFKVAAGFSHFSQVAFWGVGAPLQNSRTTCQSNQALEKNGLLASFLQTLLRVHGEVAGPGRKLDPAEGERASYPVEVIFSA